MQLIKVEIHIEEDVNGNKNNPGLDSHIFKPHTSHPPWGVGSRIVSHISGTSSQLMERRRWLRGPL